MCYWSWGGVTNTNGGLQPRRYMRTDSMGTTSTATFKTLALYLYTQIMYHINK